MDTKVSRITSAIRAWCTSFLVVRGRPAEVLTAILAMLEKYCVCYPYAGVHVSLIWRHIIASVERTRARIIGALTAPAVSPPST